MPVIGGDRHLRPGREREVLHFGAVLPVRVHLPAVRAASVLRAVQADHLRDLQPAEGEGGADPERVSGLGDYR